MSFSFRETVGDVVSQEAMFNVSIMTGWPRFDALEISRLQTPRIMRTVYKGAFAKSVNYLLYSPSILSTLQMK